MIAAGVVVLIMGGTALVIFKSRSDEGTLSVESKKVTASGGAKNGAINISSIISEENRTKQRNFNSLARRLACAQWNIPPSLYYVAMVMVSIVSILVASFKFHLVIQILSLLIGPFIMNSALSYSLNRRFKAFDVDYPAYLGSVVSMLKTGLNPISALQEAAGNLSPESLIREEVEVMLERLRLGVPEEQSIGAFAENIPHSEVELFVQALLFSRRVGGALSQTLERLARISRKRQYFRQSAVSAVGLQRGSIYLILGIMVGLEVFLYMVYPESITGAWKDPTGWLVWQVGIVMIIGGVIWLNKVTKIKV